MGAGSREREASLRPWPEGRAGQAGGQLCGVYSHGVQAGGRRLAVVHRPQTAKTKAPGRGAQDKTGPESALRDVSGMRQKLSCRA